MHRILVVGDDLNLRAAIRRMLESLLPLATCREAATVRHKPFEQAGLQIVVRQMLPV